MSLRRVAAAARAALLRGVPPEPSSVPTATRSNPRPLRPRGDDAPANVVREEEACRVSDIGIASAYIRFSNTRRVGSHFLPGGVRRLPRAERLDRITVLRRLGAVPIDSKVLAKLLEPHLKACEERMRDVIAAQLEAYKHDISVMARAKEWLNFVANIAVILAATIVAYTLTYSLLCPHEAKAALDEAIDGVAQSARFSFFGGWFGGETLAARHERKAKEEEMKKAEQEQEKEKMKRAECDERMRMKLLRAEMKMNRLRAGVLKQLPKQRLTLLDHLRHAGYLTGRDKKRLWAASEASNSDPGRWRRDNRAAMGTLSDQVFWRGRRF